MWHYLFASRAIQKLEYYGHYMSTIVASIKTLRFSIFTLSPSTISIALIFVHFSCDFLIIWHLMEFRCGLFVFLLPIVETKKYAAVRSKKKIDEIGWNLSCSPTCTDAWNVVEWHAVCLLTKLRMNEANEWRGNGRKQHKKMPLIHLYYIQFVLYSVQLMKLYLFEDFYFMIETWISLVFYCCCYVRGQCGRKKTAFVMCWRDIFCDS